MFFDVAHKKGVISEELIEVERNWTVYNYKHLV